ncbi:MAG TPA: DUF3108 domain-containing protein [Pyrinomonadaceae bacterium]|nr:DUF3108 domain-containing protein [Pyrinomonadaceae bacterium]
MHGKLRFSLKIAQLTALLVSLTCTLNAQQKSEATQSPFNAAAYRVGERLTYNVSFSQFVSAAHVELYVAGRGTFFNREGIQLRAHAETTGVVNVALFAINNDYATYVDPATGLPFRAQQVVREAGRTSDSASDYNQPAGIAALPAQVGTGVFPGTYDLLSALYRVRALPLVDGASYFITVHNAGDEYQAEVRVAGHQVIKTGVGSFSTVITRLNVKGRRDDNIRIYFSDDERHVPVLVTAKPQAGEIRAELVGSELVVPAKPAASESKTSPTPTTRVPDPRIPVTPQGPAGSNPSSSSSAEVGGPLPPDFPFKVGEQLNYQVYLANGAAPVGTISFAVRARGRYFNLNGLLFSASAQTSGAGARVFFVNDQVNSYVDPTTLLPFRTELNMSEGKHRTNRSYNLDQNRGSAVADNRERIDIPVGTHDLISLVYAIRTFDLTPPKRNAISIMATARPRTLFITSLRRETIEVSGQKVSAIQLSLTTDDPQTDRLQIRMWVGDDKRHLPLRFTAVTELGPVRADLVIVPATPQ